ncbi:MAG: hypothetical protein M5U28_11355 [Sandaracinaceae bacterium]|nr:hypothetical protein [Sandaracinaceae bacterium]
MRRRSTAGSVILATLVVLPVVVFGQPSPEWHDITTSRRLMRRGARPITVELHATGAPRCLAGNCSGPLEVRNVRGELPSQELSYFYSDTTAHEPGCPNAHRERLFASWTEAQIAPARDEDRPSCGVGVRVDGSVEDWVILRTRRLPEEAAPAQPAAR